MGMFDTIHYRAALPDGRIAKKGEFQTKHLGRSLNTFTITDDGRLILHAHRFELNATDGSDKFAFVEDREIPIHGDVVMHGRDESDHSIEYVARFTNGRLEKVQPAEALGESERHWLNCLTE